MATGEQADSMVEKTARLRRYSRLELAAAAQPGAFDAVGEFAATFGMERLRSDQPPFEVAHQGQRYVYDRYVLSSYSQSGSVVAVWGTSGRAEGDPALQHYVVTGNITTGELAYRPVLEVQHCQRDNYGHQTTETTLLLAGNRPALPGLRLAMSQPAGVLEWLIAEKEAEAELLRGRAAMASIRLGVQGCDYKPEHGEVESLAPIEELHRRIEAIHRILGMSVVTVPVESLGAA